MDPILDLCQPAPLLLGDHSGCLSKGNRFGYPLAPDVRTGYFGRRYDSSKFIEIPEEAEIG